MGQVIDIQSAGCHIGSDQQLEVLDAELLHHIIPLRLAQLAMQRIGIVAVLDQLVGNLLCLFTGTAEDDAVDIGVIVGNPFQGQVFVLCTDHEVDIPDILVSFVFPSDDDLFRLLHVFLGDGGNALRHGSREEQHVAGRGHLGQDRIDAVAKAHVQHFVCLIEDDITDMLQIDRLPFHQVQQTSRSSHDHMHTPL